MMFYVPHDCKPGDVIPIEGTLEFVRSGIICQDINGEQFKLCRLDFEYYMEEEFQYVFTPYWDEIDRANKILAQNNLLEVHIAGLDLDLRKEHYYRANCTPCFVYQHVLPPTRQDLREYLDDIGVKDYFPMDIMVNDYHKFNDGLYVIVYNESDN